MHITYFWTDAVHLKSCAAHLHSSSVNLSLQLSWELIVGVSDLKCDAPLVVWHYSCRLTCTRTIWCFTCSLLLQRLKGQTHSWLPSQSLYFWPLAERRDEYRARALQFARHKLTQYFMITMHVYVNCMHLVLSGFDDLASSAGGIYKCIYPRYYVWMPCVKQLYLFRKLNGTPRDHINTPTHAHITHTPTRAHIYMHTSVVPPNYCSWYVVPRASANQMFSH